MPKRAEFKHPRFALAEGEEDAAFIRTLIRERTLPPFDVSPTVDLGSVGGNTGFETAVLACEPITGFSSVTKVLVLADNDDDPKLSYDNVVAQIEKVRADGGFTRSWGGPKAPGVHAPGDPSVAIWMWPEPGTPGCLETLLWRAISRKFPSEAACVETACACTGADKWPVSKADKARVRAFTALHCKKSPGVTLSLLFRNFPDLLPANLKEFDTFCAFLNAF